MRRSPGSALGIGLTLVKSLIEMHGGTAEINSAGLGQGSEVVLRLPIVAEPVEVSPTEATVSVSTSVTARRVLIVDDNWDLTSSLAILLNLVGNVEIHTVPSRRRKAFGPKRSGAALKTELWPVPLAVPLIGKNVDACSQTPRKLSWITPSAVGPVSHDPKCHGYKNKNALLHS